MQLLQLLLALSLLVFVHEAGHFLFARLFGVHVEKFYLFFDTGGKALFRYRSKRSGTEYGIGWLPLGGYCKIKGMVDEGYLENGVRTSPKEDEMRGKLAWQRLFIMLGGILFNLLFAMLIYAGIAYHQGSYSLASSDIRAGMMFSSLGHEIGFQDNDVILTIDGESADVLDSDFIKHFIEAEEVVVQREGKRETIAIPHDMMRRVLASGEGLLGIQIPFVVDSVFDDTPAKIAGLQKGDELLAIDGVDVSDFSEAQRIFSYSQGEELQLRVVRNRLDTLQLRVTPDGEGHIGVALAGLSKVYPVEHRAYSMLEAIPAGVMQAKETLFGYADNMKYVFTREGANSLGGFISMGRLFESGFDWVAFWSRVALLSVIFAFMNFLPIPMLDGAEILFLIIELVSRRKIDEKIIMRTKMVGLVLLIALMIWANFNDVLRLLNG